MTLGMIIYLQYNENPFFPPLCHAGQEPIVCSAGFWSLVPSGEDYIKLNAVAKVKSRFAVDNAEHVSENMYGGLSSTPQSYRAYGSG